MARDAYNNIIQLVEERDRGKLDPYPYHVLGNQGLMWAKKGIKDTEKRRKYLEDLFAILEKGVKNHPRSRELKEIKNKLKKEILSFAVRN